MERKIALQVDHVTRVVRGVKARAVPLPAIFRNARDSISEVVNEQEVEKSKK